MKKQADPSWNPWIPMGAGILAAALHIFTAIWYLDHPAIYDEMYHVVAAHSLVEIGEPVILDGSYERSIFYTWLLAGIQSICNESLSCARLSSLGTTTLLVLLFTAVTGQLFGVTAGLIAGVLLAVAPPLVATAQFIRSYAVHALLVSIAAYQIYMALNELQTRRIALRALVASAALLLAYHLLEITLLAVAGLCAAAIVASSNRWLMWFKQKSYAIRIVVAVFLLVLIGWLINTNTLQLIHQKLFTGPLWSAGLANNWLYYHHYLKSWYPVLWALAPLLMLAAFIRRPQPVTFCAVAFAVAFIVLSAAWTKSYRYLVFALPFLFVPLGLGIAESLRALWIGLTASIMGSNWSVNLRRMSTFAAAITIAAGVAFYLSFQPLTRSIIRMAEGTGFIPTYGNYGHLPEWRQIAEHLRELARDYPVVVTSSGVPLAWYLGDFSYDLHASTLADIGGGEFTIDSRTGRSVISRPASLRAIILACGPGMAVIEEHHAGDAVNVPEETITELETLARRIAVGDSKILVWVWDNQPRDTHNPPGDCRQVDPERLSRAPWSAH